MRIQYKQETSPQKILTLLDKSANVLPKITDSMT